MIKVLLVEDDQNVRAALVRLLERRAPSIGGLTVTEAENGSEAWTMLQAGERFNIIISDNDMPVMSGLELLTRVHKEDNMRQMCFILVSGMPTVAWDDPRRLEEVCEERHALFLQKPFGSEQLLEAIVISLSKAA